jgi:long-subunit fatty acid transport protein
VYAAATSVAAGQGGIVRAIIFSLALLLLVTRGAYAAGFQTLEQGIWDMGRAVVGAASAADSAATVFYNPAGMTRFDKPQVLGGIMGPLVEIEFELASYRAPLQRSL